jgi:L-ascorbate metabolism protein UlaG (beta-lactamase superfamily)
MPNPLPAVRARRAIRRRAAGQRVWPPSFADRLTDPLPSPRDMLRIMRERGFRTSGGAQSDANRIPVRREGGLPRAGTDQTLVTWVGHATYVIQIGGITVLTDPVWSNSIPGGIKRLTPPGVAWSDLPQIDAVLISHNHYDHLDAPTIRRLARDTPIYCPAALGDWFTRRGFVDVTELDWWESAMLVGVRFDFVPAHHWSRRGIADTCATLWGGWILTAEDGTRIYFGGDTAYGKWFAEIGSRYPDIDLALMPVGAYEPRWFMRNMHVNPDEAVRACGDMGAPRMATMHWGTFMLSSEPLLAPVERARAAWAEAGYAAGDLWDMTIGETRTLAVKAEESRP